MPAFEEILAGLMTAPGAVGAAFLDPHGQAIAQVGDAQTLEVLGAYQSVWLWELGRAAERSGLGAVSDVAMDFDRKRVLTAQVKDGYFLLVVVERSGLLAVARARLGDARARLASEL